MREIWWPRREQTSCKITEGIEGLGDWGINVMIEGVIIKKLKVIPDERGRLMEILRADDEMFERFGQVYLTTAYPGAVKGWHYHRKQSDNMAESFKHFIIGAQDLH